MRNARARPAFPCAGENHPFWGWPVYGPHPDLALAFYAAGSILYSELSSQRLAPVTAPPRPLTRILRDIAAEFGLAEILDSLIIRPASTWFAASVLGDGFGVLVGKLAADVIFYAQAIVAYERRSKREGA